MPIRHNALSEMKFDRDAYAKDRPIGTWKAKVDQAVYSKGSKTSMYQKGKRAGIHLYVQHENGQKIWLFVPLLPGLASFATAAELNSGDVIEVEVAASTVGSPTSTVGSPVVKRLQKLEPAGELQGKKS